MCLFMGYIVPVILDGGASNNTITLNLPWAIQTEEKFVSETHFVLSDGVYHKALRCVNNIRLKIHGVVVYVNKYVL